MTKALMKALPSSIRVGPYDFAIELMPASWRDTTGYLGEFSPDEHVIRLQAEPAGAAIAIDTLLHEIGHAIWWGYHLADSEQEERVVSIMGTAWTQVYKDNPALLQWIAKGVS